MCENRTFSSVLDFLFINDLILEFNNCHPEPCINGTCMDQDNIYTSSCYDGYNGTNCGGKPSLLGISFMF